MSKKHKMKRKSLEAQLMDAEQRRSLAEYERDTANSLSDALEFRLLGAEQEAAAFAREVLRAAGANGNGNGDLGKVRRLARGWLDS